MNFKKENYQFFMNKSHRPLLVFIAYSRKDGEIKDRIIDSLKPMMNSGILKVWYDQEVNPGDDWADLILKYLKKADLVLPILSRDFLASGPCLEESKTALKEHAKGKVAIIPIIARTCDWKITPLRPFQALPENGKHVVGGGWNSSDAAYQSILEGIRKWVNSRCRRPPAPPAALPPIIDFDGSVLHGDQFDAKFEAELRKANRVTWISRTGSGWLDRVPHMFPTLPNNRRTQFLFIDPRSRTFKIDSKFFWTPSRKLKKSSSRRARNPAERKERTETILNSLAQSALKFRVRVTTF